MLFTLLLAATALSTPTLAGFTFTAYAPGDHIFDHLKVEAVDLSFTLGFTRPASYCPLADPSACPPGNETVFYNPSGLVSPTFPASPYLTHLSQSIEVPGGQQVYMAPSGQWAYTEAHSDELPVGATYPVWQFSTGAPAWPCCPRKDPRYNCDDGVGYYTYQSPGSGGLFACPPPWPAPAATFALYGNTPGFNLTGCVAIEGIRAHNYTGGIGAWEYT
ncbi:hypothetical protein MMC13_007609 [Lambiella insularis]|nr:hypothetical protein [Lambiella insularis]